MSEEQHVCVCVCARSNFVIKKTSGALVQAPDYQGQAETGPHPSKVIVPHSLPLQFEFYDEKFLRISFVESKSVSMG